MDWNAIAAIASVVSALMALGALLVSVIALRASDSATEISKNALSVSKQSLQDDHEYKRRQYSAELISKWDERTLVARTAIMRRWSDCYKNNEAIPRKDIDAEFEAATRQQGTSDLMVQHIGTLLNYLDDLALAVQYQVGDEVMLRAAFDSTFKRWMRVLGEYRTHIQGVRKISPWAGLDYLDARWKQPATQAVARTGVIADDMAA
ncbi:hypothetical protein NR798_00370 [Archangium gephyra]|uniref:DUF4760 domain-containing protein n=1 Tax=Archangium gephyra TaxID=48 RepID=UPI0035D48495